VLLSEKPGPVRVRQGARSTVFDAVGEGVGADGRALGPRHRIAGTGPLAVAGLRVHGALEIERVPDGLRVVNHVSLEDYLAGTLGREVYPGWESEALKAQAVVARSYALHERARRAREAWDVTADTRAQVYGGIDAETPAVLAAVEATRAEYLAWRGRPILAAFHSASGGRTASAEEVWGRALPYLVSVEVPHEEDSPDTYWRASVSGTTLGRALDLVGIRVGSIRELRVAERSASGRARWLALRGSGGTAELTGRQLRGALGETVIRSTLFEIRAEDGGFVFVGSGHGHGVGMSQWGAQGMARQGTGYRDILATFYPGSELVRGDR
jgi:stage II sporulation protein D